MQPLGTKVYLLKRYSLSDRFCTFFSWEYRVCVHTCSSVHLVWTTHKDGWQENKHKITRANKEQVKVIQG